jgi:hypothetical protein
MYNLAAKELADGSLDFVAQTIKVMLVDSTYVANRDHDYVDEAGANDPIDAELSGTGYTAGWGNSGRKTLVIAGGQITEDDANDRAEIDSTTNPTWTGINAGTAAAAILIREGGSDDTDSLLICYIDSGGFPVVTGGGDLTINWNAEGIIQLSTT